MDSEDHHDRINTPDRSTSGEDLNERITLRTSSTLVEEADQHAEEEDLERSEVLRRALREYFDV